MHRFTAAVVLYALALSAPARAQAAVPPRGMSGTAFWFAESCEMYQVTANEAGFAKFHAEDKLIGKRLMLNSLNLTLPVALRWVFHRAPRQLANQAAIEIGATALGYGTWTLVVVIRTPSH